MALNITEKREFEWKIHNFTKDALKEEIIFLRSNDYSIILENNETKWNIGTQINKSELGIYLKMQNSDPDDFTVNFEAYILTLSNKKKNKRSCLETYDKFKVHLYWGWSKVINIEEILNNSKLYLQDNTLKLGMKIELVKKKEPEKITSNYPHLTISKEFFASKSLSDCTLVCSDGVEILAHRFILAGFSPVFKAIFETKAEEGKNVMKIMVDIDDEIMTEILRFVYTQEVKNIEILAPKLLQGAVRYELDMLKERCIAAMIKSLSLLNAVDYFLLADRYKLKGLLARSAMFIKLHCKKLSNKLDELKKNQLIMILKCDAYNPELVQVIESKL